MAYAWEKELPALAALSDTDAAQALSNMVVTVRQPITRDDLLVELLTSGQWYKWVRSADEVSLTALELLKVETVDLDSPKVRKVLAAAGLDLAAKEKQDAISVDSLASKSQSLYGKVTDHEVHAARIEKARAG
jgi:hypothetical protein